MDYLFQKVSYLQGLADGLNVDENSSEGKLLVHIIDTLGEFAEALEEVSENQMDLEDYVNFIDEDLADLEEDIYGDDFEDYDDFDFEFYDDCCDDEDCGCFCEEDEE
ncbi:CD1247 N-terminal domain-containing protein [Wansuia hejianensis]|uniref:Uncharacterized protein n=1 Tax=Wansuia hejianensis TaxID=2763667 RepID=A0A926IMG0_9FIRM|nr:CD1247 N-terminal domain-containing protein [Wansuia hejianensis]MBC8590581.1 hypothetical protein [Wansuia hejianensis]